MQPLNHHFFHFFIFLFFLLGGIFRWGMQIKKPAGTRWYLPVLVGLAGFEPTHAGVKVPCLTAWRQPSLFIEKSELFRVRFPCNVGWLVGLEPTASRATIWRASQLRHSHHILVRPEGLEPPAHCLEGSCSIHLSYGRLVVLPWETLLKYNTIPPPYCQQVF